jgi:hypothetical protein
VNTWAVVELLGHNQHAGWLTEELHFGAKLGRVDIPDTHSSDPKAVLKTHYFGGSSVFRITPCDEATARRIAGYSQSAPPSRQLLAAECDEDASFCDCSFHENERAAAANNGAPEPAPIVDGSFREVDEEEYW